MLSPLLYKIELEVIARAVRQNKQTSKQKQASKLERKKKLSLYAGVTYQM